MVSETEPDDRRIKSKCEKCNQIFQTEVFELEGPWQYDRCSSMECAVGGYHEWDEERELHDGRLVYVDRCSKCDGGRTLSYRLKAVEFTDAGGSAV